jgi:predicted 3-demethylubiquinone-9 3-methyltransferase (glyoxalase superfamily)
MTAPAQKVTPFLMFTGAAEEAMTFYTSLFDDGEILEIERCGLGEPGAGAASGRRGWSSPASR